MGSNTEANALPTELRTERLVLRSANMDVDSDCANVHYIYASVPSNISYQVEYGPDIARQLRYKNKVDGPRQELCTLATAPANMFWLIWLPLTPEKEANVEDLSNLVGFMSMSFRPGMPYPDMDYATLPAHAGHGYASEAGKEMLHYWRDLVGVREIYVGCPEENSHSQRCAERIGFALGGKVMYEKGSPPNVETGRAVAYVLPGMQWIEGRVVRLDVGPPAEGEKES